MSPQLPDDGSEYWNVKTLDRMLDLLVKGLRPDPDRFAAIAPIAGRGDVAAACKLKDLQIWAFHGDRDVVVPMAGDYDMVQAVRRSGGTPRLTIDPDIGNASWVPAYDDAALYQWLLEHRRPAK